MSGKLLLGIDIGTASSKAVLTRASGEIVARAQRQHMVSTPRPGWVEHDAEETWWGDIVALCAELLPGAPAPVSAVHMPGQTHFSRFQPACADVLEREA